MVDIPLDRLLEIGYADLHRNQQKYRETALLIDKTKTPQQILAEAVRIIRRRINCCRHFAIHSADCGISSSPTTSGDDSFAGAADSGRDAAVYARDHFRFHGHAGAL